MIFVTGGTGMVGGEIVRLLSQNGTAARALVSQSEKREKSASHHTCHRRFWRSQKDITRGIRRCQNAVCLFQALAKTR